VEIPFTILAFFPEYRMMKNRASNLQEMIEAFATAKATGLKMLGWGKSVSSPKRKRITSFFWRKLDWGPFERIKMGSRYAYHLKIMILGGVILSRVRHPCPS